MTRFCTVFRHPTTFKHPLGAMCLRRTSHSPPQNSKNLAKKKCILGLMGETLVGMVVLLLLLLVLLDVDACNITVKIRSETKQKFRIQLFVPSLKLKSAKVLFTGPEEKKLKIEGPNCWADKWVVRTWKLDGGAAGGWTGARQESARLDALVPAWLRIVVGDDLRPMITDRESVICSEGSFCG